MLKQTVITPLRSLAVHVPAQPALLEEPPQSSSHKRGPAGPMLMACSSLLKDVD